MARLINDDSQAQIEFDQLHSSFLQEIDQVETELDALIKSTQVGQEKISSADRGYNSGSFPAYWDQVMNFATQDQTDEAIAQMVRVVQRLLDEKANNKILADKASKEYVDSLSERVGSGVRDNLMQTTSESRAGLDEQIEQVRDKIADIQRYMQNELRQIQELIEDLKNCRPGETQRSNNKSALQSARTHDEPAPVHRNQFSVYNFRDDP